MRSLKKSSNEPKSHSELVSKFDKIDAVRSPENELRRVMQRGLFQTSHDDLQYTPLSGFWEVEVSEKNLLGLLLMLSRKQ
jgi:hypothetical protein